MSLTAVHTSGNRASVNSEVLNQDAGTLQNSACISSALKSDQNPLTPVNLFQDSCGIKLDSLSETDRKIIDDLIKKISYQINYFRLDSKKKSKGFRKLICKICGKFLSIDKVEEHVQEQKHLRNLVEKCKKKGSTYVPDINEENWTFLEFSETYQLYECSLCRVKLASATNSWIEHFKSSYHNAKLKDSVIADDTSISSSVYPDSSGSTNSGTDSTEVKSDSSASIESAVYSSESVQNSPYNFVGKPLLSNTEKSVKHLSSNSCEILPPVSVSSLQVGDITKRKIFNPVKILAETTSNTKILTTVPAENLPASGLHSIHRSSFSLKLNSLNATNEKKVMELVGKVNFQTNTFDFAPIESKKLCFICKLCSITLRFKKVEKHVDYSEHVKNVHLNSFDWNFELFNSGQKKIVRKLYKETGGRIINFDITHEINSEKIKIVCKVCCRYLDFRSAVEHANFVESSKDIPLDLLDPKFKTLTVCQKKIVRAVFNEINKTTDFGFFANECSELHLVCKLCNKTRRPKEMLKHVYSEEHLMNQQLNSFIMDFKLFSDKGKKTLRKLFSQIKSEIEMFDFSSEVESGKICITCKVCKEVLGHARAVLHIKPIEVSSNFSLKSLGPSYEFLNECHKKLVRKAINEVNDKIYILDFKQNLKTNGLSFTCKFCDKTLRPGAFEIHFNSRKHLKKLLVNEQSKAVGMSECLNVPSSNFHSLK